MFGEAMFIYNISKKITEALVKPYEDAVIREKHKEQKVEQGIKLFKGVEPVNSNRLFSEGATVEIVFEPCDPLHRYFGSTPVYITPNEIRKLDCVTDWSDPEVLGVIKFIAIQQEFRAEAYNANS